MSQRLPGSGNRAARSLDAGNAVRTLGLRLEDLHAR